MTEDDEAVMRTAAEMAKDEGEKLWPEEKLVALAEQAIVDCVTVLYSLPAKKRAVLAKELAERLEGVASPA